MHADVAGRAGEACFLPPAGPPNPGVSPKSLGRQPRPLRLSRPGPAVGADRAPRGVLSTRGARHPAASACDIQARAGCLPGAPTSKVREPPPPPCPRVSQPPCSPHDPVDSRCPRPPGSPTSVQCHPVFSAAQANTATLSSPCPPLALPRDSPGAVRAVLAAPPLSRGPAAAAQAPAPHRPGQRPRPTAHWPAGALHWPTSLTAKAAPGSGPQTPTMLRPALSASEASVGQPWTPPQTFPRDTRQNTAPNALCPTCGLWHLPPPWTPSPSRPGRLPVVTVRPPHPEQCPVESTISEYFLSKWRNKPKHFLEM